MITIMSNRAYRFPNPGVSLVGDGVSQKTTQNFGEAYAEVHPGDNPGTFGNPTQVPDWVKHDRMFKMALDDKNLVVLSNEPLIIPSSDVASREATIAAASAKVNQEALASAAQVSTPALELNLSEMSKEELVKHASEVHGLTLDKNVKKTDLIAAIQDADSGATV